MIYLDHNATTPLRPAVRAAMESFLAAAAGNPSSVHRHGRAARSAVEEARHAVAAAAGVPPGEVVFTSGGTESNNLALLGAVDPDRRPHVVVSPIEHSCVLEPIRALERRGARVTWLPVDRWGRVRGAEVAGALRDDTVLVSVGWANNEIGTVQPVAEIGTVCRRHGVLFHVDAVQALGRLPMEGVPFDLCALSAHKIGGPTGVGALLVRAGVALEPRVLGGGQERGRRAGTENVLGIVGFGAAAALAGPEAALAERRERLWAALAAVGEVRRYSPAEDCLPNTLNVGFAGVRGEVLVAALDLEGVAVSVGSACAAGSGEPSHVLRAVGYGAEEARDGVRFSLGGETTVDEIDRAAEIVAAAVRRVRGVRRRAVARAS